MGFCSEKCRKLKDFSCNLSLKIRLSLAFIILIFILETVLLSVTQYEFSKQMIIKSYDAEYNSLKSRSQVLDEGLKKYDEMSVRIFADSEIRKILQLDKLSAEERYGENLKLLKEKFNNLVFNLSSTDITSIVLVSPNKIYTSYDLGGNITTYKNEFYDCLKEKRGKLVIFETDMYPHVRTQNISTFAIGRLILGNDMKEIGYEVIFISSDFFKSMLKNLDVDEKTSYYILSNDDHIMFQRTNEKLQINSENISSYLSTNKKKYFTVDENGKNLLITQYKSKFTGWTHVSVTELINIKAGIYQTIRSSILIAVILIIMCIIVVQIVVKSITMPLTNIQNVMKNISDGDITLRVPDYNVPEVKALSETFNQMLDRINQLMLENCRKQELLRKTELQMLQAQINPHFLYNTLNSIRWMAIFSGQDQIKRQIDNLTVLLRSAISDTRAEIPLKQEIEILKCYSDIMRMRYFNFKMEINVDKSTEEIMIPKFILQPIVENSILHGLAENKNGGCIWISTGIYNKKVLVSVEDNGIGMTVQQVENCMKEEKGHFNHIGITNVNQRIKLIYGEEYGLTIESETGRGTKVTLILPETQKDTVQN